LTTTVSRDVLAQKWSMAGIVDTHEATWYGPWAIAFDIIFMDLDLNNAVCLTAPQLPVIRGYDPAMNDDIKAAGGYEGKSTIDDAVDGQDEGQGNEDSGGSDEDAVGDVDMEGATEDADINDEGESATDDLADGQNEGQGSDGGDGSGEDADADNYNAGNKDRNDSDDMAAFKITNISPYSSKRWIGCDKYPSDKSVVMVTAVGPSLQGYSSLACHCLRSCSTSNTSFVKPL